MNEWQTKYYEERERAAVATNELAEARTNSEDRPRPPLPNETLQAMLQLMNQGRNYTERVNQIQVVRLLTGWGLAQASGFVDQNRPAAATEAPTT
jgi:ribosomal protein L7/L12